MVACWMIVWGYAQVYRALKRWTVGAVPPITRPLTQPSVSYTRNLIGWLLDLMVQALANQGPTAIGCILSGSHIYVVRLYFIDTFKYFVCFCFFFSIIYTYIPLYINTCWVALRRFNHSYLLTSCDSLLIFVRGVDPCIVLTAVALLVGDANPNPNSNPDPNSNNSDSVRWRCEP